jgi:hypothetical protein
MGMVIAKTIIKFKTFITTVLTIGARITSTTGRLYKEEKPNCPVRIFPIHLKY